MSPQSFEDVTGIESWVRYGFDFCKITQDIVLVYRKDDQIMGKDMGRICNRHETRNVCSILVGNLKVRGNLLNPDIDEGKVVPVLN
jgi:hypothetical protein